MRTADKAHQILKQAVACRWLLIVAATACTSAPPPPPGYRLSSPEQSSCLHSVRLLSSAEVPAPYRELSRISVTCPYLVPSACEQRLLARGCALGADAVVLTRSHLQRTQPGRDKGELADEAVAIRFQPAAP